MFSLTSHVTQNSPQADRAQSEPVIRVRTANITPISDAATAIVSHVSRFVLRYIILEINTTAKARYAVIAIGT